MGVPKVVGVETEYGIMLIGPRESQPDQASLLLLQAFQRLNFPFVHSAGSRLVQIYQPDQLSMPFLQQGGGESAEDGLKQQDFDLMLSNGARFYIDHAHPEYSVPECLSPLMLVAADKAGEQILADSQHIANTSGMLPRDHWLLVYKNNSDYKNNSYGCHENYLVSTRLFSDLVYHKVQKMLRYLLPFLVTRILYCGAGKVGTENGAPATGFQLSQRADFFETLIGLQTTQRRPLFNIRDEAHADIQRFRRLHIILGDANMAEFATYLKVGTMQLVLRMLEENFIQVDLALHDPLEAFQTVSRDLHFCQLLRLENGQHMTALQIQRVYLDLARQYLEQTGGDAADWKLWQTWEDVLVALPDHLERLAVRLDWAIKLRLFNRYLHAQGAMWEQIAAWQPIIEQANTPEEAHILATRAALPEQEYEKQRALYFALRRLDLEYHDIRYNADEGEIGLFYRLQQRGGIERLVTDAQIQQLKTLPPSETRAWLRGTFIRHFSGEIFVADWSYLRFSQQIGQEYREMLSLPDPLAGSQAEAEACWPASADPASVIACYKKISGTAIQSPDYCTISYETIADGIVRETGADGHERAEENMEEGGGEEGISLGGE